MAEKAKTCSVCGKTDIRVATSSPVICSICYSRLNKKKNIKPLRLFDLNDPEQIKLAFAPENHQWLTIEENLKKGAQFNDNNQNS